MYNELESDSNGSFDVTGEEGRREGRGQARAGKHC